MNVRAFCTTTVQRLAFRRSMKRRMKECKPRGSIRLSHADQRDGNHETYLRATWEHAPGGSGQGAQRHALYMKTV
ncbi:hypothetical protein BD310DRAFT_931300 [Dichomitus squalens]|uniref:Uncharacterized protein n=1 Tax=Dichomitus squalens TaxID=114155 RepID=A0A4Q9PQK6_9APHY|nr:hypothetical protein BD310DRAFT_931300 [Dichomitus squalens]